MNELAELSDCSKSFISQVKNGKRPPSQKIEKYLRGCMAQYQPNGGNIWNLNRWGIAATRTSSEEPLPVS